MKQFCYEFYPGEVLRQIRFFSTAQKAAYLDIVSSHIENIRFSYDLIMKITSELNDAEKKDFLKIFDQDQDGYFISWVVSAIEKRSNYIASRSKNKTGKTKNTSKSYENHMVDVYVDVNNKENNKGGVGEKEKKITPKKQGDRPSDISEVVVLFKEMGLNGKSELEAQEFMDWYTNTNWTQGKAKTPLLDWTAAARRWARPKLSNLDKSKVAKPRTITYP